MGCEIENKWNLRQDLSNRVPTYQVHWKIQPDEISSSLYIWAFMLSIVYGRTRKKVNVETSLAENLFALKRQNFLSGY